MKHWLVTLVVVLATTNQAVAAPVGMAAQVKGSPQIKAGAAWKPLRLLQRLQAGDTVRCGTGAEAVIVLFGYGHRYKIAAGQEGTVRATAVAGATAMGGLSGPSTRVAMALGGSRSGAFMARPAVRQHGPLSVQTPEPMRGWMPEGERRFQWDAIPNAAQYSFTLFDRNDAVLWNARVTEPNAEYPAEFPALRSRQPYVWRVTATGKTGRLVPDSSWGIVTFLSKADADQMTQEAEELQKQAREKPDDLTPLVLLAELYRTYGVHEKVLTVLEDQRLAEQAGIKENIDAAYHEVGAYAYALSHRASPTGDE